MMDQPIKIVLVDDHRLFRSGIASLINNLTEYKIIFEAENGEDLIRKLSPKFKPDIILLDMNMPVMNGESTAQWLIHNYPEISIIVLSMIDDPVKVLTMIRMGVKGYLLKSAEPSEFEEALKMVSQGELYYPEFITHQLIQPVVHTEGLHPRETDFLKLACTEMTYREIADQMCISVRTVDGYRDQLFEKLGAKNRVGLVLYAIKNKIIEL
jgi:DNA-binding NarL/FixJ family response regulator